MAHSLEAHSSWDEVLGVQGSNLRLFIETAAWRSFLRRVRSLKQ